MNLKKFIVCGCFFLSQISYAQDSLVKMFYNKPLTEQTIHDLQKTLADKVVLNMDIQYGGPGAVGLSEVFMIGPKVGKDTVLYSTGHISCFSVYFDAKQGHFIAHIDADRLAEEIETNSGTTLTVRQAIQSIVNNNLQGDTLVTVRLGASNIDLDDEHSLDEYKQRLQRVIDLLPSGSYAIILDFGPNATSYSFKEILTHGGPDAILTTDVFYYLGNDGVLHLMVTRPPNGDLQNASKILRPPNHSSKPNVLDMTRH